MQIKPLSMGIAAGIVFCLISAAFDVFVGHLNQRLDPAILIIYCFIISTLIFFSVSITKNRERYIQKAKNNIPLLLLINFSVMLNWGGLILSLKYLEPAVVGIASVACGPAITIVISRYFIKQASSQNKSETIIAWIILFGVMVMLANSYFGKSGIADTSYFERTMGIIYVICSAIGTVLYTFYSKNLSNQGWMPYEILGFRNILMLASAMLYCFYNGTNLIPAQNLLIILLLLAVIGHVIPILLIQYAIKSLEPIHVSMLLLLLPIFTLAFQYFDHRVAISIESILAVLLITVLLCLLCLTKIYKKRIA